MWNEPHYLLRWKHVDQKSSCTIGPSQSTLFSGFCYPHLQHQSTPRVTFPPLCCGLRVVVYVCLTDGRLDAADHGTWLALNFFSPEANTSSKPRRPFRIVVEIKKISMSCISVIAQICQKSLTHNNVHVHRNLYLPFLPSFFPSLFFFSPPLPSPFPLPQTVEIGQDGVGGYLLAELFRWFLCPFHLAL